LLIKKISLFKIIENIANHFRQFSKKEKEHLQQKKQAIMKKDKENLISGFISFSENLKVKYIYNKNINISIIYLFIFLLYYSFHL